MNSKIIQFPSVSRPRLVVRAVPPPAPVKPTVTFTRPFILPGMDTPHAPGTFEVLRSKEALDVVWEAYRVSTRLMLTDGPRTEMLDVNAADLEAALADDLAAAE
jgi:hypothetical protein